MPGTGISLGGKRAAPVASSGTTTTGSVPPPPPPHPAVQALRNVVAVAKSAILWVREMVTAVAPQPKEVKRTRSMEPFDIAMVCLSVVGMKHWRASKSGWERVSERVVWVLDSMKKTPSSLQSMVVASWSRPARG